MTAMSTTKKYRALFCLITVLMLMFPIKALALEAPYSGYSYDYWGRSIPAPIAYMPDNCYYGEDIGANRLNGAEDLLVYKDKIYIADTGNNRILVLDSNFQLIKTMTEFVNSKGKSTTLNAPTGLFIKENVLYIADSKNGRVLAVDLTTGVIIRNLRKPNSSLIPQENDFIPIKVVVDYGDNVYVGCVGYYYGLVMYNPDDKFTGFFGGNEVQLTISLLSTRLWKSIFSKDQRESLERAVPVEYSNMYIVGDFIYTCAKRTETSKHEIQKLNPLGIDILAPTASVGYDNSNFGDIETATYRSQTIDNSFVDIHVDDKNIISVLDQERGRVFLYDQECNFLGTFGVTGSQRGSLKAPTAMDKLGDTYLVMDKGKNCIVTYKKSEYMELIEEGLSYYSQGLYKESVKPWQDVLQYNSRCSLAYKSIAKSYMQDGQYASAMKLFKLGQDRIGYSRALREYRKYAISKYFVLIIVSTIVVIVLVKKLIEILLKKLGAQKAKNKMVFC